jgi:hypothetical protein
MRLNCFTGVIVSAFLVMPVFAAEKKNIGFEAGVGSGFIIYGDSRVREQNSSFNASNQVILAGTGSALLPLADSVFLAAGLDTTVDLRWKGSKYINYWDYAGTVGFRIYPGLRGLAATVEYALGRRSDFLCPDGTDESIENTAWGNGFKLGVEYDFSSGTGNLAPVLGTSWRHMPRGGSSDNCLVVYFKVSQK